MLTVVAIVAAVPLVIFELGIGGQLSSLDLILLLSLPVLLTAPLPMEGWKILAFVAAALGSAMAFPLLHPSAPFGRSLMSWAYFVKPYFAFFVGYFLVRSEIDLRRFLAVFSLALSLFLIVLFITGEITPSGIRDGMTLIILPVYGTVNALMAHLVLSLLMGLATLWIVRPRSFTGILISIGLMIGLYAALISASRQAALSILLVLAAFPFLFVRSVLLRIVLIGLAIGLTVALTAALASGLFGDAWATKIDRSTAALTAMNLDALSASRLLIYAELSRIAVENPILASGFTGFEFLQSPLIEQVFRYTLGMSPHNQWLGALWKMGLLGFVPYVLALGAVFLSASRLRHAVGGAMWARILNIMLLLLIGFFCLIGDALTFPPTGILMLLVSGMMARIARQRVSEANAELHISPALPRHPAPKFQ